MTSNAPPRERPLRRWHRRIGWVVGPWLVLMAVTGLVVAAWPDGAAGIDPATGRRFARPAVAAYDWIHALHAALAWPPAGSAGTLALGLLLAVALAIGLRLGWPRRWRDVMLPAHTPSPRARWFGWHRAAGWWLLGLLSPVVLSGALLAAVEVLPWPDAALPAPVGASTARPDRADAEWVIAEAARHAPDETLYRVRLHDGVVEVVLFARWGLAAGQNRRLWFDAQERRLLRDDPRGAAPAPERLLGAAFALHGGHWAGPAMTLVAAVTAAGAVALASSGLWLWWLRRRAA